MSTIYLDEASRYLGISKKYLYRLTSEKKIDFRKQGKRLIFTREQLDRFKGCRAPLIEIEKAAELCGLEVSTIQELCRQKLIPAYNKLGTEFYLFDVLELDIWIKKGLLKD